MTTSTSCTCLYETPPLPYHHICTYQTELLPIYTAEAILHSYIYTSLSPRHLFLLTTHVHGLPPSWIMRIPPQPSASGHPMEHDRYVHTFRILVCTPCTYSLYVLLVQYVLVRVHTYVIHKCAFQRKQIPWRFITTYHTTSFSNLTFPALLQ